MGIFRTIPPRDFVQIVVFAKVTIPCTNCSFCQSHNTVFSVKFYGKYYAKFPVVFHGIPIAIFQKKSVKFYGKFTVKFYR